MEGGDDLLHRGDTTVALARTHRPDAVQIHCFRSVQVTIRKMVQ
jgi:hypothetical protein